MELSIFPSTIGFIFGAEPTPAAQAMNALHWYEGGEQTTDAYCVYTQGNIRAGPVSHSLRGLPAQHCGGVISDLTAMATGAAASATTDRAIAC